MSNYNQSFREFVEKQRELLRLEKCAEEEQRRILIEETPLKRLCHLGEAVAGLCIDSIKSGLFGRTVIKFIHKTAGVALPSHKISVGDIVGVSVASDHKQPLCSGVVSKVTDSSVVVAIDEDLPASLDDQAISIGKKFCLVKLANEVTFKRLSSCLNNLENYQKFPGSHLVELLLEKTQLPSVSAVAQGDLGHDLVLLNDKLNEPQREAMAFAINPARPVSIIHGPPGTGKTTVVVEIINHFVKQGLKVLVCAPSNIAVDNIIERLAATLAPGALIRLGHPARVTQRTRPFTLDAVLKASDESAIVSDVRADINKNIAQLQKGKSYRERTMAKVQLRDLRKELRQRESRVLKHLLSNAAVIASTLTSASQSDGPLQELDTFKRPFDVVLIDECAQALEMACWIALLQCKRCILVGDHCQLPPTILSDEAAKKGLSLTLMERLVHKFESQTSELVRVLNIQYRMNQHIMNWASELLYDNCLLASDAVRDHLLSDMPNVAKSEESEACMFLIDTDGCDMPELLTPEDASKGNIDEVKLVMIHLEKLLSAGVKEEEIAIISPYNLQVSLIRRAVSKYAKIGVRSIDGFQGQEREVVILSLVRSNDKRDVGFLSEVRRLNVAVTRAKRHLAVMGDFGTVGVLPYFQKLFEAAQAHGIVRSAAEYQDELSMVVLGFSAAELADDLVSREMKMKPAKVSVDSAVSLKQNLRVNETKMKSSESRSKAHVQNAQAQDGQIKPEASSTSSAVDLNENDPESSIDTLQCRVDAFVADESVQQLAFEPSLTSFERRRLHEIAESMQLLHSTSELRPGVRVITLKKRTAQGATSEKLTACSSREQGDANQASDQATTIEKVVSPASNGDAVLCQFCCSYITSTNFVTHGLHCQRIASLRTVEAEQIVEEEDDKSSSKPALSGKKNKKSKPEGVPSKDAAPAENGHQEDVDTVLDQFVKDTRHCYFERCKQGVTILGQKCPHCAAMFCLRHSLPEAHGCGDAARAQARSDVRKQVAGVMAAPVRGDVRAEEHKEKLQAKLNKKMDALKSARTSASKGAKK